MDLPAPGGTGQICSSSTFFRWRHRKQIQETRNLLNALSGHQVLVLRLTRSTQCFCVLGVIEAFPESVQIQHPGYSKQLHYYELNISQISPSAAFGNIFWAPKGVTGCGMLWNRYHGAMHSHGRFSHYIFQVAKIVPFTISPNVFLPINPSTVVAVHVWQCLHIRKCCYL